MRYHFSGIGGAGMNPLARLLAARGHEVQGSDRDFDRGRNEGVATLLRDAGIALLPQDGSAISSALDAVIHSTAVEADTPEMQAAAAAEVQTIPRPALLAELIADGSPGLAIAGTSGKSTVVGMVAWILRQAELPATVLGGAALAEHGATVMGCFSAAGADAPVIAEACESDGTLRGYQPAIGLVHNISRDHDELTELEAQFTCFIQQSQQLLLGADCAVASRLAEAHSHVLRYGTTDDCDYYLQIVRPGPDCGEGLLVGPDGVEHELEVPQAGAHNLCNALAAVAAAHCLGVTLSAAVAALASFPGVARRFQDLGRTDSGIKVIDDYAHNGAKIEAAISAAQLGCDRLVVVFQPHGFGPARFLRPELKQLLPRIMRAQDRFCYAEIYYAGGTVAKDISARQLTMDLPPDMRCGFAEDHQAVLTWIAGEAGAGDTVLILGARDPQLPALAQAVFDLL